jgi:hypothetical protein
MLFGCFDIGVSSPFRRTYKRCVGTVAVWAALPLAFLGRFNVRDCDAVWLSLHWRGSAHGVWSTISHGLATWQVLLWCLVHHISWGWQHGKCCYGVWSTISHGAGNMASVAMVFGPPYLMERSITLYIGLHVHGCGSQAPPQIPA